MSSGLTVEGRAPTIEMVGVALTWCCYDEALIQIDLSSKLVRPSNQLQRRTHVKWPHIHRAFLAAKFRHPLLVAWMYFFTAVDLVAHSMRKTTRAQV